uniref:Multiple C2 and transmembrane domain containing 1 n=1 Tax=Poecilia reticulata TaxID=8081 RepID=A0A3P9NDJ3_POERE
MLALPLSAVGRSLTGINIVGPSNAESQPHLPCPAMYQLDIVLKKGKNLAIRDRTGTSDPYVKFKIGGKEVFRSKTIHKNLNPVWDERVILLVETLREPLYVKVFDYDFGLQDDFMGSAYLHLESLEHQRTLDVTLDLKDPQYPEHDLGSLELTVTLSPKEGDIRDAVRHSRKICGDCFDHLTFSPHTIDVLHAVLDFFTRSSLISQLVISLMKTVQYLAKSICPIYSCNVNVF